MVAECQFEDMTEYWNIPISTENAQFGNGLSLYDFNNDGLDDITIAENQSGIACYVNDGDGFTLYQYFPAPYNIRQVMWVDFDNDLDPDLFYTTSGHGIHLYKNNGNWQFTEITNMGNLPANLHAYGASWGDYDRDGYLDVFVCVYDYGNEPTYPNYLLHNNGDESFEEVGEILSVDSYANNSFQSCWYDFDNDGWLDLYVINDHFAGNEFYRNSNGQYFENLSIINGSGVMMDAMSNSISDFDNDGDADIYVTNDTYGNNLLVNDNGVFTNMAIEAGVATNDASWGALWFDIDLDGLQDLQVSTSDGDTLNGINYVFRNLGDGTFINTEYDNLLLSSFVCAKGDLNNDNRWDYMVCNSAPSSTTPWKNKSVLNHSVKINLQGTISNRDAVGTSIEYFYGGNRRVLQTQCGENYISQDSQHEILATSTFSVIDSVLLHWPSGWVDVHYNLPVDSFYHFIEGETYEPIINVVEGLLLCAGDSVLLSGPDNAIAYQWSNGSNEQHTYATDDGEITLTATSELGITGSSSLTIASHQAANFEIVYENVSCQGYADGVIEVVDEMQMLDAVIWNATTPSYQISGLTSDIYSAEIIDNNGCHFNIEVEITEPEELIFSNVQENICYNTLASVDPIITGGVAPYSLIWPSDIDPSALTAGTYVVVAIDDNGCSSNGIVSIGYYTPMTMLFSSDTACYNGSSEVNFSIINGEDPIENNLGISSGDELTSGNYNITFIDNNSCILDTVIIIESYDELIAENVVIPPSSTLPGTATIMVTGGNPPYSFLWTSGETSSILNYDEAAVNSCVVTDASGCTVATGAIELVLTIAENLRQNFLVSPNPFTDHLMIKSFENIQLEICNAQGAVIEIISTQQHQSTIDTSDWASGIYVLRSGQGAVRVVRK